jgi:hypothetical protein
MASDPSHQEFNLSIVPEEFNFSLSLDDQPIRESKRMPMVPPHL